MAGLSSRPASCWARAGTERPAPAVLVVIVDRWTKQRLLEAGFADLNVRVVTAREYVGFPRAFGRRGTRIINLSRRYAYMDYGYYCSLLAEARGHRVIPTVTGILTLGSRALSRLALPELDAALRRRISRLSEPPEPMFDLFVAFGQTDDSRFQKLARHAFDRFRCPLLLLRIENREDGWCVRSVRALASRDLNEDRFALFQLALERHLRVGFGRQAARSAPRYSIAMLHNPREAFPPSSPRALRRFIRAGMSLGMEVELIEPKDLLQIAEYDALFIRETTSIDDHTYRVARRAEYEGMVVLDDPDSIVRCTNKVFLAELLAANGVPSPRTVVLEPDRLAAAESELGYPMVLKVPDGSFSRGIHKVQNREELRQRASELFKRSDVILAQQYVYTDYDWRVGILNGRPLFVCQYFMSRHHWQIIRHGASGPALGRARTFSVEEAPKAVVETALRAARLIGDGLYGVDLKETADGVVVMEVNDNPNIDAGIEDQVMGDALYLAIMEEFARRLDHRRRSPGSPPL